MTSTVSAQLRLRVHARAEERCEYCQTPEELTVTTFELDHIVPLSAGGVTVLDNLCLACPACNRQSSTTICARSGNWSECTLVSPAATGVVRAFCLERRRHSDRGSDTDRAGHRGDAANESSADGTPAKSVDENGTPPDTPGMTLDRIKKVLACCRVSGR